MTFNLFFLLSVRKTQVIYSLKGINTFPANNGYLNVFFREGVPVLPGES